MKKQQARFFLNFPGVIVSDIKIHPSRASRASASVFLVWPAGVLGNCSVLNSSAMRDAPHGDY